MIVELELSRGDLSTELGSMRRHIRRWHDRVPQCGWTRTWKR